MFTPWGGSTRPMSLCCAMWGGLTLIGSDPEEVIIGPEAPFRTCRALLGS